MTSPNTIIETNIERILEDHLWNEVELLDNEVKKLQETIDLLNERKAKLIKIANAAELNKPNGV